MIILITGASHTGKTLLAQRMLEKHKYPYLSIDHLKMGLIRSGNTELTPEDDEALTGYLWPIIREIMKTVIENRQNLIIEGCYIPFDWRKDFDERYLLSIRFICLAMSERYIENHFGEIIGHESEIESRMNDADCTIDSLKTDNKSIIDGFQNAGEQVMLIDSDYEQTIKALDADTLMFFDRHLDVLPLYRAFEKLLFDSFPVVNKRVQKTQISFSNRHVFTCVSFARVKRKAELPKRYMVITLGLPAPLDSERVAVKTEPYPGRWTHHIVVSSPEELDEELLSWMKTAYTFADAK